MNAYTINEVLNDIKDLAKIIIVQICEDIVFVKRNVDVIFFLVLFSDN